VKNIHAAEMNYASTPDSCPTSKMQLTNGQPHATFFKLNRVATACNANNAATDDLEEAWRQTVPGSSQHAGGLRAVPAQPHCRRGRVAANAGRAGAL
jgi:hypothetical protein